MKIYNASGFPTPVADLAALPQILTADRGFWAAENDPAAGNPLPAFPAVDPARLAALCKNAKANYNGTIILDLENAYLAKHTVAQNLFDAWVAILSDIIDMMHSNGVKVGMFGLPISLNVEANYTPTVAGWTSDDVALASVCKKLDMLCPGLYGLSMDLGSWCTMASYVLRKAEQIWPGKPIIPFLNARAIANDPTGAFEDKTLFYRRLVFLKNWPVAAVAYWDAQFDVAQAYKTLGDLPVYNMLKMATQWDPIYPPDSANWLA